MTNPPFSEDHKERCLRWALATRKPFALFLPAYVVERRWFREACGDARPFFVAPAERYGFDHPLGAGADNSPFFSVWVVDSGRGAAATAAVGATLSDNVFADVDALRRAGHVRAEAKRPNPKRRRQAARAARWRRLRRSLLCCAVRLCVSLPLAHTICPARPRSRRSSGRALSGCSTTTNALATMMRPRPGTPRPSRR